jgi:hypothetical protein
VTVRHPLEDLRAEFEEFVSDPATSEEDVHQFLVRYPVFLPLWMPLDNIVFSKLPLGNEHVPDFAHARHDTPGLTWHFIELEAPSQRLFRKSGDPTAGLVHAIRQAEDWRTWFIENRDYASRHLPFTDLARQRGLYMLEVAIVIGRRAEVADSDRRLLQRLSERVRIMTYDRLIDHLWHPGMSAEQPLRCCSFRHGTVVELSSMTMRVFYDIRGDA